MMSIVFNFFDSALHQKIEAVTIKAGYLLSSEVCMAGTTRSDAFVKEILSDLSVFQQLDILEKICPKASEFIETVKKMRELMQGSSRVKNKTGKHRAKDREGKELVCKMLLESLNCYRLDMNQLGFRELDELTEEDTVIYLPMNPDPEDISNNRLRVSDLMQRFLLSDEGEDEDLEPELFFLGAEFLGNNYERPFLYHATDKEAKNKDNIYLHHCFTLPDINRLTCDELRSVHHYIMQSGDLFHQHSNQWIDMCYDDDDVAERTLFFKNKVVSAANALQRSINKNGILKKCQAAGELTMEVWMGEVPVVQLWNYYKHHDAIKEQTWNKLMKIKSEGKFNNQRWPVLMLYIPNRQIENLLQDDEPELTENNLAFTAKKPEPGEEIKATRKYISID